MDILGFLVVIGALFAGQHFGFNNAAIQAMRKMRKATGKYWLQLRYAFINQMAEKTFYLEVVAAAAQSLMLLLAYTCMKDDGIANVNEPRVLFVGLLFIAALFAHAIYQWPARPQFLLDEEGNPQEFPDYLRDDDGHWLEEDNTPIRYPGSDQFVQLNGDGFPLRYIDVGNDVWRDMLDRKNLQRIDGHWRELDQDNQPIVKNAEGEPLAPLVVDTNATIGTTDLRVPHPMGGYPILDPEAQNRIGRFSFSLSLALILGSALTMSTSLIWLGVANRHSAPVTLGIVEYILFVGMLWVLMGGIAWTFRKSVKLLEGISTIAVHQGLLAMVNITKDNVSNFFTGVNLFEEDENAEFIRTLPLALAAAALPGMLLIWMWPHPDVAKFVLGLMFVTSISAWVFARQGGELEVSERKYQLTRMLSIALPVLMLMSFALGLVPGIRQVLEIQAGNAAHKLELFLAGKPIPYGSFWPNVGLCAFAAFAAWALYALAKKAYGEKGGAVRNAFAGVFFLGAAAFALTFAWSLICIGGNLSGHRELQLMVVDRDNDGVVDYQDKCLESPENMNGVDDADGCPEKNVAAAPAPTTTATLAQAQATTPPSPGDQKRVKIQGTVTNTHEIDIDVIGAEPSDKRTTAAAEAVGKAISHTKTDATDDDLAGLSPEFVQLYKDLNKTP